MGTAISCTNASGVFIYIAGGSFFKYKRLFVNLLHGVIKPGPMNVYSFIAPKVSQTVLMILLGTKSYCRWMMLHLW